MLFAAKQGLAPGSLEEYRLQTVNRNRSATFGKVFVSLHLAATKFTGGQTAINAGTRDGSTILVQRLSIFEPERYPVADYAGAHSTTMSLHAAHARMRFRNAADNKDNNSILLPTFALPLLSFHRPRKTFSNVSCSLASPRLASSCLARRCTMPCFRVVPLML